MEAFKNVDEILDFAMRAEQEAVDFYTQLASRMKNPEIKNIFLEFAKEEVGHKARIKKVKEEKLFELSNEDIEDLKISDYTVRVKPSPDMDYADALLLAMNKEKAAFKLYTALSERTNLPELKKVFRELAKEESKHKLRFEIEYDEYVLREN
ncbi:MAG: ferritin family protein [Bacteroidales bacterium]